MQKKKDLKTKLHIYLTNSNRAICDETLETHTSKSLLTALQLTNKKW